MKDVTISLHEIGEESHIDIFFETSDKDTLKTYETQLENWKCLKNGETIICTEKQDHRAIYLNYEGEITNNRGKLKILWKGKYISPEQPFKKIIKLKFKNESILIL